MRRPLDSLLPALLLLAGCGFDGLVLAKVTDAGPSPMLDAGPPDDAATADAAPDAPPAPEAGDFGQASGVFTGQSFTCALLHGHGSCFGANVDGALGSGDDQTHLSPVPLAIDAGFDLLSSGENHTCGLAHGAGAVFCWGYNASGQLGLGDVTARDTPTLVPLALPAITVAAGYNHTCAITADGALWCWGDNTEGQLGQNDGQSGGQTTPDALSPVRVGTRSDWLRVAGGQGHTCAIESPGTMWCWGRNTDSETGTDPAVQQLRAPAQTGTFTDWTDLDVGQDASCGLRADGSLWCWGDNSFGQLGSAPASQPVSAPAQVGADTGYAQVSIDTFSACARKTSGAALCWGRNVEGQLGVGDTTDRYAPTAVQEPSGPASTWASVSVGRFHTCFGRTDGDVYCTGDNSTGQLGLGDTVRRNVPTLVPVVPPGP